MIIDKDIYFKINVDMGANPFEGGTLTGLQFYWKYMTEGMGCYEGY